MLEFRYIPKYGKKYKVYNDGRIIKNTGIEILPKHFLKYKGQLKPITPRFSIMEKGKVTWFNLAYLVAELFIENPDPKIYTKVKHKDGILNHCSVENLYWDKPKQYKMKIIKK